MKYKIFLYIFLSFLFISGELDAQRNRSIRRHNAPDRIQNNRRSIETIRPERPTNRQRDLLESMNQPAALPSLELHGNLENASLKELDDMMWASSRIAVVLDLKANPLLKLQDVKINLYHFFLAGITEITAMEMPTDVSFIDGTFFNALKELGALEEFQFFLLRQLGFDRDNLGPFEIRPDGGLILDIDNPLLMNKLLTINEDTIAPNEEVLNMIDQSILIKASPTLLSQRLKSENSDSLNSLDLSHLFLAILTFENPIRSFLLDHLTNPPTLLERTVGWLFDSWSAEQRKIKELKAKLYPRLTPQTTGTNYHFDIGSFHSTLLLFTALSTSTPPPDIFSDHDYFLKILEQETSEPIYLTFNYTDGNTTQVGKVISIQKNQEQPSSFDTELLESFFEPFEPFEPIETGSIVFTGTSLFIETLDGKRYTYYHIRDKDSDKDILYTPDIDDFSRGIRSLNSIYDLNNIRVSNELRDTFQYFDKNRSSNDGGILLNPFSTDISANSFRDSFNLYNSSNRKDDFQDSDQKIITYINTEGERVPGQIIDISPNGITVKSLNGQSISIEGEQQLNTILQSAATKSLFEQTDIHFLEEDHAQVKRKNVEGQFDTTQIEMSGDPAKDAFRRGLIEGVLKGDQRFISFKEEGEDTMTIARAIEWKGDDVVFQVYTSNTHLITLKKRYLLLWGIGDFWKSIRVSSAAKSYFIRNSNTQDNDINRILGRSNTSLSTSDEYHFLSRTSAEVRGEVESSYFLNKKSFTEVVDWTDSSLKRWMRRATDIIEEKTGITPGAQDLNADQRSQIYQVWLNDIVPLVEDIQKYNEYGHLKGLIYYVSDSRNHSEVYLSSLGHILDTKTAVCKELSEFGIILFSEYGLQTKYMSIEFGANGHGWIKIHGDGFVEYINSNGRIKKPHTDLRFLKEHYLNLTDEEIPSSIKEVNLVTPPSR